MPAPTNISAATATSLGATLPAEVTQNVHDAGTTYTVWYVLPAKAAAYPANFWAFGDLVTYRPQIKIYSGSPGSLVTEHTGERNKPIQFVVQANTTYYLEIIPNAGNPTPAILALSVVASPMDVAPRGSIFIPDDIDGTLYPAAVLAESDGEVLRFVLNFSSAEQGDVLHASRVILMADINANNVKLWDARDFSVLVDPVGSLTSFAIIRANHGTEQFFVSVSSTLHIVSAAGVIEASYTGALGSARNALAGSNDGSTVYHVSTSAGAAIQRWDVINQTALSNLAAGIAGYQVSDILVLNDDSIIASYWNGTTDDFLVKRYNAAGTTLNTYSFGTVELSSGPPRLGYALEATQFLVFFHPVSPAGYATVSWVRASDGTIMNSWTRPEYAAGDYAPDAEVDPARAGSSPSCPIMMLPIALGDAGGETGIIGPLVWVHCLREVA